MFEPMELTNDAVIKVIGVVAGGGNAVEHMVRERIEVLNSSQLTPMRRHCVRQL